MGAIGGSFGSLVAELLPEFGTGIVNDALHTGAWSGTFAALLTVFLVWAGEIYRRGPQPSAATLLKALASGAIAGGIAGAIAQAVFYFSGDVFSPLVREFVVKPLCWGLMGVLLGWRFSTTIPNLGFGRGAIGGAVGGIVGGIGFVAAGMFVPEVLGRMVGVGVLGLALGLAIVTAETLFRAAALEVIWGPKETMTVTLGDRPVTIGGGDDHVFLPDLGPSIASVGLSHGKIFYTDKVSGKRTELRDGSRLEIGKVTVVVRAKK